MSPVVRGRLLRYGIASLVGVGLTVLYLALRDVFSAEMAAADRLRLLSDAFLIPGLLLILSGVLYWCAGKGSFDGLAYSVGVFCRSVFSPGKLERETYQEYLQRKQEKRAKRTGSRFLYLTGGVFLVLSAIFLLCFYVVE